MSETAGILSEGKDMMEIKKDRKWFQSRELIEPVGMHFIFHNMQ